MSGAVAVQAYQYVALRCVPRVEREEFCNVGVVLYCHATNYLAAAWRVDEARLAALGDVDPALVRDALAFVDAVCAGTERAGGAGRVPVSQRFGFLKAPRSTVLQPGPVHGGVTADPARQLGHLLDRLTG
ncbi:DUF3037 domain-containing protein [Nocardioides litoris]|uniref:DUF3037 domain-containing protein n=1 Tax=Nocardioides litoris TaxID=1926648 RepID=UPI001FE8FB94|nr:DUF3037 domain-containing protein [Nocardioides litoris]